jgi:spore coat protein JB
MNNSNASSERSRTLMEVQCLDFAVHEAALFLDVNIEDEKALKYFGHYSKLAQEARFKYESKYGPLRVGAAASSPERWTWVDGPWPWEYSAADSVSERRRG